MAIEWENFDTLERMLKKSKFLRSETIERTVALLNMYPLRHPKELEEKIRKIEAFNEYLAFEMIREECHHEFGMIIKSPADIEYKIGNSGDYLMNKKLRGILENFKDLTKNPKKLKWDIIPQFTSLSENLELIEYNKGIYTKSPQGSKLSTDLMQSLRAYGILEFCYDREGLFKKKNRL